MSEFVTGSLNSVVFWEEKSLSRRRSVQPFPDSDYHVASLSWSSTYSKLAVVPKWGDRIAVCDFSEDILTWNYLLHKDGGAFTCGCLLHNSRYLVSGCGNSSVLVWDLKHKKCLKTLQGHTSAVTSVAVSSNDHFVVSGSQDGNIFLHPLSSSSKQKTIQLTKDMLISQPVTRLALSLADQSHLGSASEGGDVCLWSVDSQRMLTKFSPTHTGAATDICFTPSNSMLMVSVGMDASIKCYDLQHRKIVTTISAPAALSSVAMLKDGSTLLAGGTDGRVYVYELRSLKTPKAVLEGHQSAVTCIAPQYSNKTPSKRNPVRGSGSQVKVQMSPEKSLFQSSEKSSPKGHQSSTQPVQDGSTAQPFSSLDQHIDRKSLIHQTLAHGRALPETVTPFVTHHMQGGKSGQIASAVPTSLEVQTPYSTMNPGLKNEIWGKGGPPLTYVLSTPATDTGNISSIFSPLEQHRLDTPASTKITATVPPTMRGGGLDVSTPPVHSVPPTQTASSLHIRTPAVSTASRPSHANASLRTISSGEGIFSPLDAASYRHGNFASPLLQQSPQLSVALPTTSHVTSTTMSHASHMTNVSTALSGPQRSHDIVEDARTSREDVAPKVPGQPSPLRTKVISKEDTWSHAAQSDRESMISHSTSVATDEGETPPRPPPVTSGGAIQTQYLERVIKDSSEELWYSMHRDTRGLTVDIIKQFLTLQEGLVHQFSALNEKVDRLTEDNRQLKELVQRYMPKH